jgi:carboxylesterase type B
MDLEGSQFDRRAQQVVAAAGASWPDVLHRYAQLRPELNKQECFNAAVGDMWFRVPSLRIADGHQRHSQRNTFVYLFEWSSPLIGAAHALDLMVFGNGLAFSLLAGWKDYAKTAEFMRKAWVAFAESGKPDVAGQPWPAYTDQQATLSINQSPSLHAQSYRQQLPMLEPVINANWRAAGL